VGLNNFLSALTVSEFEEEPVDLRTFLYSEEYMGLPPLSKYQEEIVEVGSQIYRKDTLVKLYGEEEGNRLHKATKKELVITLGKGSGKDMVSGVTCCYIVYKLLCLKDPATYYGKPKDDAIDIVNVGVNAAHAQKVFYSGLKSRIKNCPWFAGKYTPRASDIEFDKNIRIHSLNSEGSSSDGMNCLVCVFDEGDDFDQGDESPRADAMYKVLSANVSSRFADIGKLILLSYPRTKNGFMMKKYNEAVAEKETVIRKHTFVLNEELPDDHPGNSFDIEWEEDHIISYKFSNVWALRRPTWDANPTKRISDFVNDFYRDPVDALGRFACCPNEFGDGGWFRDKDKIDASFTGRNGISEVTGPTEITIKPNDEKQYYMHVDLARVQDNCAVSMAHVESFKKAVFDADNEISPFVVVDILRYWKPDRNRPIDFSDVRDFIISLKRTGFNIQLVTFDRWNSDGIIEQLNSVGIKAEKLSVGRDHYSELALLMGQNMIKGPDIELLKTELKRLVVLPNGNVDHTNKSSKDASDAVCGAVYNASVHTPRDEGDYDVVTYADIIKQRREEEQKTKSPFIHNNVIEAPKQMPSDIADYLSQLKLL
jgi:hypothetical protein